MEETSESKLILDYCKGSLSPAQTEQSLDNERLCQGAWIQVNTLSVN